MAGSLGIIALLSFVGSTTRARVPREGGGIILIMTEYEYETNEEADWLEKNGASRVLVHSMFITVILN